MFMTFGLHGVSQRSLPGGGNKTMTEKKLDNFKAKQAETLNTFRQYASAKAWEKLHRHHFDWWMFLGAEWHRFPALRDVSTGGCWGLCNA